MKSKGVFIFSTEFPPTLGGIGTHAFELARELHGLGWKVKVFAEQTGCSEQESTAFNNASPFYIARLLPTPSMFLLLLKALKLFIAVVKYNPALIVGTGKHGAWFAVLIGKLTFKKTALIGHGTEFTIAMSARSKKINNWVYSNADSIIYVSNYTKQIAEQAGVVNANYHIIYNGADNNLFKKIEAKRIDDFKRSKKLSDQSIVITIGKLQPRKGNEWVIRSMPEILKAVPNAHYYCIGSPNIQPHLENVATELGVTNHVHFTGMVTSEELLLWCNACDVFTMTSIATNDGDVEGFGIAILEAALCGKPSVVTSESGPGEAIIEGETGYGVKEKDTAKIAEKIILLLTNQTLNKTMGEKARVNAETTGTWAIVVKKYSDIFSALIQ